MDIRLIEVPEVNLVASKFDDFEVSKEGPELGFEEEPESLCLTTYVLDLKEWRGTTSDKCLAWNSCCIFF